MNLERNFKLKVTEKLLKRIVVDSRFSDGDLLSSGTYRINLMPILKQHFIIIS